MKSARFRAVLTLVLLSSCTASPIDEIADPPSQLLRESIIEALDYWAANAGITYELIDVGFEPRLLIRPGTDGALALAVGNVVVAEGLVDEEYVAAHTTGVDAYRAAVADWTPDRAAAETGVPPGDIVELARLLATARPAAIRLGVRLQPATRSGSALRAIQCLPALTGQWRWPAGGIAGPGSLAYANMANLSRPDLRPPGTREVNMIQLGRVLTDPSTDPPVRSLYVWNSNPAVIAADQRTVLRGLRRDALFTVVHDQFLTDTARHADVVLPATTMLEQPDLVGSWGFSHLSWSDAAIAPRGEARSNAEVARNLAAQLGFDDEIFRLDDHALMRRAMDGSFGEAEGATADRIRAEGVVRVGPPTGTAVAADATFDFACDALATVGLHPIGAQFAFIMHITRSRPAHSSGAPVDPESSGPVSSTVVPVSVVVDGSMPVEPSVALADPPVLSEADADVVFSLQVGGDSVRFVELAIEGCDGRPSYVETHQADYSTYCPWGARVVERR